MDDANELMRLQMENTSLKQSLQYAEEKNDITRKLLFSNLNWRNEAELNDDIRRVLDACDEYGEALKEISSLVVKIMKEEEALKYENRKLEKQLQFAVRDNAEMVLNLTREEGWKKAIARYMGERYRVSAEILCYAVKGCTPKEIVREMAGTGGISITVKRVSNALSVKKDKDLLRISTVFHKFQDMFREYGISKEDLVDWYTEARIRTLGFIGGKEAEKG